MSDFLDFITLDTIKDKYNLSIRAINVCRIAELYTLNDILNYYQVNGNFLKIPKAGLKTSNELCLFCSKLLSNTPQNTKTEKNLFKKHLLKDIDLDVLQEKNMLSTKSIRLCRQHILLNAASIYSYYEYHKCFFNLVGVGIFTNKELCLLCLHIKEQLQPDTTELDSEPCQEIINIKSDRIELDSEQYQEIDECVKKIFFLFVREKANQLSSKSKHIIEKVIEDNCNSDDFYDIITDKEGILNIKGIGEKTMEEIEEYIENVHSYFIYLISLEEETKQVVRLSYTIKKYYHLDSFDSDIYLNNGNFLLFRFINYIIYESKILSEREIGWIEHRTSVFESKKDKLTLDALAVRFSITRERMRQIEYRGYRRIEELVLEPISAIKKYLSPYLSYRIDTEKKIVHLQRNIVAMINSEENTSFSSFFICKVFSYLYEDIYTFLDLGENYSTYLIQKSISEQIDVTAFIENIKEIINSNLKDDLLLDFDGYLYNFFKSSEITNYEDVKIVCEYIILNDFFQEIEIDENNTLIFKRNVENKLYQKILALLSKKGEPMNINEIYEAIVIEYPEYLGKDIETFRSSMRKEKNIFIYFGRSSTYGLLQWEDEHDDIKGGTIRDIIEEYLSAYNEPKHIIEIIEYIKKYRPNTNISSLNSNLQANRDRFLEFKHRFWGLHNKNYQQKTYNKIPKFMLKYIVKYLDECNEVTEQEIIQKFANDFNLLEVQIKYYIYLRLEEGKLKQENGIITYDKNSIYN